MKNILLFITVSIAFGINVNGQKNSMFSDLKWENFDSDTTCLNKKIRKSLHKENYNGSDKLRIVSIFNLKFDESIDTSNMNTQSVISHLKPIYQGPGHRKKSVWVDSYIVDTMNRIVASHDGYYLFRNIDTTDKSFDDYLLDEILARDVTFSFRIMDVSSNIFTSFGITKYNQVIVLDQFKHVTVSVSTLEEFLTSSRARILDKMRKWSRHG